MGHIDRISHQPQGVHRQESTHLLRQPRPVVRVSRTRYRSSALPRGSKGKDCRDGSFRLVNDSSSSSSSALSAKKLRKMRARKKRGVPRQDEARINVVTAYERGHNRVQEGRTDMRADSGQASLLVVKGGAQKYPERVV